VLVSEGLDQGVPDRIEVTMLHEDAADRARLVGNPGRERGDQGVPADEVVLQGQQAEEEVASRDVSARRRGRRLEGQEGRGVEGRGYGGLLIGESRSLLRYRGLLTRPAPQFDLQGQQLAE
jgi:hypothetical protein